MFLPNHYLIYPEHNMFHCIQHLQKLDLLSQQARAKLNIVHVLKQPSLSR